MLLVGLHPSWDSILSWKRPVFDLLGRIAAVRLLIVVKISSMADRLLEHALDGDATTTEWREAGFRAASEAGAFFAVTAGSRMAQAALGITTRAPPVAALATLATVCVGAVAASCAGGGQFQFEQPTIDDALRAAACGVTAYALLGGRPTSLTPSHLASVGAFGWRRASLAASRNYATDAQRKQLASLGRRFGCHTCGVKSSVQWIADHQPPQKIAALRDARWWKRLPFLGAPTAQRFYPQCAPCSQKQSAAVRVLSGRSVLHLPTVRPFHLTGFVSAPLSRASAPKKRWYE